MFEHSPYYHPLLRLRRIVLCRLDRMDLMEWREQPMKLKFLQLSRVSLMMMYFVFKVLEWWHTSDKRQTGAKLPVPPPPDPPQVTGNIAADPAACSICSKKRQNPALLAPSGYVFCYPCIAHHVTQHGSCPVTGIKASMSMVRRLYEVM
uniref:Peroxin-12 n=1 Tax=Eutreptiella gymnastica TaxID=73025 RepID=A0A7S4CCF3_9EUGL